MNRELFYKFDLIVKLKNFQHKIFDLYMINSIKEISYAN